MRQKELRKGNRCDCGKPAIGIDASGLFCRDCYDMYIQYRSAINAIIIQQRLTNQQLHIHNRERRRYRFYRKTNQIFLPSNLPDINAILPKEKQYDYGQGF